jgi:cathepsin L
MNLAATLLLLPFAIGTVIHPMNDARWRDFKVQFGKFYKTETEELDRYTMWRDNIKHILEHNTDTSKSFILGVNNFTDMTHSEFRQHMGNCFKIPKEAMHDNKTLKQNPQASAFLPAAHVKLPASMDWRMYGAVTPIKNQGQCGSCWAFSSTGALEGQTFRKTKKLPSLSEQNLVDCVKANAACNGGWMDNSFAYIRDNQGIDSEAGYPYYAKPLGYCYYNAQYKSATDTGFVDLPSGNEQALMTAVATIGPISVAIDATHPSFMSYRGGVYYEPRCGNTLASLDHAVLVVGYGTDGGWDYWLVKNSWGTYWGEQGYIRMARNRNDHCGIALKASYPLV